MSVELATTRTIYPTDNAFIVEGYNYGAFIERIRIYVELSDKLQWLKQKELLKSQKMFELEHDIEKLLLKYFDIENTTVFDEIKKGDLGEV